MERVYYDPYGGPFKVVKGSPDGEPALLAAKYRYTTVNGARFAEKLPWKLTLSGASLRNKHL